ncbi:TATA-binding protein-associated factor [Reticulomyxa filosa]|uniref:TATA-binding protein-associated factor n=1 Tax=Reticulomyxa filosa TaxID=46433 RepID=X6MJP3_RETFI|nr:TATA-binding protein-associated factor [Reticulomyxa filosa]|eukprot:ETO13280.1 TATA-binding protein-associated factor [Reticulomyxa filosa]
MFNYHDMLNHRFNVMQRCKNLLKTFQTNELLFKNEILPFMTSGQMTMDRYFSIARDKYKQWEEKEENNRAKRSEEILEQDTQRSALYSQFTVCICNTMMTIDLLKLQCHSSVAHVIISSANIQALYQFIPSILKTLEKAVLMDSHPTLQYRRSNLMSFFLFKNVIANFTCFFVFACFVFEISAFAIARLMKCLSDNKVGKHKDKATSENRQMIKDIWEFIVNSLQHAFEVTEPIYGIKLIIGYLCQMFGQSIFEQHPKITKLFDKYIVQAFPILDTVEQEMKFDEQKFDPNDLEAKVDAVLKVCLFDYLLLLLFVCLFVFLRLFGYKLEPLYREKHCGHLLKHVLHGTYEHDDAYLREQCRFVLLEYLNCDTDTVLSLIISFITPKLMHTKRHFRLGAVEVIVSVLQLMDTLNNKTESHGKNREKWKRLQIGPFSMEQIREQEKNRKMREELLNAILPYLSLLVIPLFQCLNDNDKEIRMNANSIFALAVRFIPLSIGSQMNANIPTQLKQTKQKYDTMLQQLIDPSLIEKNLFDINKVKEHLLDEKLDLRPYQKEGLNWLLFLHDYCLHGILADDMGLGKTLQTLLILVYSYYHDSANSHVPSLVVCPSTVIWHWKHEVEKFFKPNVLNFLFVYSIALKRVNGSKKKKKRHLLKDIEKMRKYQWQYYILDEGHTIKNTKTKLTLAVKILNSKHRLILSGTPIQNNVLELWSLFDFLMPGYLSRDETSFNSQFSSPIQKSYQPKATLAQQKVGNYKLEKLHKQVLPFILRRLKSDVLTELPPKIIQDYYVELSPLQKRLYIQSQRTEFESMNQLTSSAYGKQLTEKHLKLLVYLRRLCIHPKLVLDRFHPLRTVFRAFVPTITFFFSKCWRHNEERTIRKTIFFALDILHQCGIGETSKSRNHRAIIFVKLKQVMELIESLLLRVHFKSVKYLTMHGKISSSERYNIAKKFNEDMSVEILLLTISVGGLGLNLSTADVVIFMENDWNPMKDLQAMDRVHRIGQVNTVQVYRIICKDTIESEIMSLQKFKQHIANVIISTENNSMRSMAMHQILDLFQLQNQGGADGSQEEKDIEECVNILGEINKPNIVKSEQDPKREVSALVNNLKSLWNFSAQYEQEFDLKLFVRLAHRLYEK